MLYCILNENPLNECRRTLKKEQAILLGKIDVDVKEL